MSFEKIEFVKPNDILQGGFNPNLPSEITVTEQLLYSIANNLAILNNNLINSGALQNLALIGDLMQEVLTDDRVQYKKTSVLKTGDNASSWTNQSVFVASPFAANGGATVQNLGIAQVQSYDRLFNQHFWTNKETGAIIGSGSSSYNFTVPVPTVNVSSSPAIVNVSSSAPSVTNNVPVPSVTNNIEVAAAVPEITVNASVPVVNNIIDVPSVTNEISVQSATPNIEVSATAPIVNVSSSPATVNVNATAPTVNNVIDVPVPGVTVQSAVSPVNVSSTAPIVNVSSAPVNIDNLEVLPYDDSSLIAKIEEMRELLEDALLTEVEADTKKGLADILDLKDTVINVDYPGDVVMEDFNKVDKIK